jgi:hypothetical protein
MPHAEMAIGVDANHVPAILRAGRLLSQHDTGTSGGSYDPDYRRDTEDDWGMEKPIYGVWRHPEIEDRIWGTTPGMHDFGAYGNVTFQAKRNLQGKQFFTHGDSLGNPVPPTPIGEADRRFDRSLPKSVTYIESQFQPDRPDEGLPLSDIKSAEVRVWGSKTDDIENFEIRPARAIQDYGIPTTVFRRGTMTQPTLGHQFNDEYSEGQASRRNKFNASLREHDEETGAREFTLESLRINKLPTAHTKKEVV